MAEQKSVIDTILERMRVLQDELEEEVARRGAAFRYRLVNGRVVFEDEIRRQHRRFRVRLWTFLKATRPLVVLSAPVTYGLIVPLVLLDLFTALYQAICFPVYGIPKVKRRDHIRIDRHHLAYLNGLQKLNCVYCGYANGLIAHAREVAARTEAYWCPIKHAGAVKEPHRHYPGFLDYGDAERFRAGLEDSRADLGEDSTGT
ncbi:hypothetical protein [Marimonas arenosa]|uniref:Uncharacterized protein n=1 Tax=Marimonas arenosa TaxID=1795305 RepID=A0AAE4B5X5_9RHOB|nr:hypothetical protein [Marimonas arenosa]MDQ2091627.1 hypothetical protein [Marimonas arenosa]